MQSSLLQALHGSQQAGSIEIQTALVRHWIHAVLERQAPNGYVIRFDI